MWKTKPEKIYSSVPIYRMSRQVKCNLRYANRHPQVPVTYVSRAWEHARWKRR